MFQQNEALQAVEGLTKAFDVLVTMKHNYFLDSRDVFNFFKIDYF
jgi:hypothetical protein